MPQYEFMRVMSSYVNFYERSGREVFQPDKRVTSTLEEGFWQAVANAGLQGWQLVQIDDRAGPLQKTAYFQREKVFNFEISGVRRSIQLVSEDEP